MTVSPDGATTTYEPFAYSPKVYPRKQNPRYDQFIKPKETMVRFQDGVDELSAKKIAQAQLQRFAEPGITGSITLTTDPRYIDGSLCPRMLIRAGVTLRIRNLFGIPEGVLVHVTDTSADFTSLSTTLNFDSKYRDQLTVDEVKARTKDALTPLRALQVGKYSNTVQDLVLPWSYKEGSGCVPLGSREFFNEKLPSTAKFPYEEWTQKFPPRNPAYRPYYIRLNPTNTEDSTRNWTGMPRAGQNALSIPIRMGQGGTIRLSQIAAYDKDGNVLPVRFHVSVYDGDGVSALNMPKFDFTGPLADVKFLRPKDITVSYESGQSNPFFKDAWESVREDGTTIQNQSQVVAEGSGLKVGWGNYFEPAGYSPGRFSRGAQRTGLLQDDSAWTWSFGEDRLDMQSPKNNATEEYAGMLFVMIYCDEQGDEPVYFMGRFFRQEPGTQ